MQNHAFSADDGWDASGQGEMSAGMDLNMHESAQGNWVGV